MKEEARREYIDTINKLLSGFAESELRLMWVYASHIKKSKEKEGAR